MRWHAQLGIPTNARSAKTEHLKENLDVFNWTLADDEMKTLSTMPQCEGLRGDRYDENCDAYSNHKNATGPSRTC